MLRLVVFSDYDLKPSARALNQSYKPPRTTTIAPRSQNPKAPTRGAARDRSPSIRPQTDPQEESPEVELLERKANSDYNNAIEPLTIA